MSRGDTRAGLRLISGAGNGRCPEGTAPLLVHAIAGRSDALRSAPVISALDVRDVFRQAIVHVGTGAARATAQDVLDVLGIEVPTTSVACSGETPAERTGSVMVGFERELLVRDPHLVVVSGESDGTLGCTLAAAKLGVPVSHLAAGLRSRDWSTPEEVNRVIIDRLSDSLFTHAPDAAPNLAEEGVPPWRVHEAGNTLVDALRHCERAAAAAAAWRRHGVRERAYVLVTLHRRANVDDPARLEALVQGIADMAADAPVLFPLHPRTRDRLMALDAGGRLEKAGVVCLPEQPYVDFLSLEIGAGAIVTDSAGVQEETSALGVPCHTVRPSTERTVTLTHGTNALLGDDPAALAGVRPRSAAPTPAAIPLWDGHAGQRVADTLAAQHALAGPGVAAH